MSKSKTNQLFLTSVSWRLSGGDKLFSLINFGHKLLKKIAMKFIVKGAGWSGGGGSKAVQKFSENSSILAILATTALSKGSHPLPNRMFFYTLCKGGRGGQTHV